MEKRITKKSMKQISLSILTLWFCLLWLPCPSWAQLSQGGRPLQGTIDSTVPTSHGNSAPEKVFHLTSPVKTTTGDTAHSLLRVALLPTQEYSMQNVAPQEWGQWYTAPDGTSIWRGKLSAERGQGISLFFDRFHLQEGQRLFISSPNGTHILGAFTEQNNSEYNDFATAYLPGQEAIVQFESPHPVTLPWRIKRVTVLCEQKEDKTLRSYEPWFKLENLECAPNTIAYSARWGKQMQSIVLMIVRGQAVCSGVLINNTRQDGKAYVLTASHCMNASFYEEGNRAYSEESARSTLFYFNFFSPSGGSFLKGIEEQTLSGARIVAWDESRDLCLLEITGVLPNVGEGECAIPPSYMPYFSGWNVEEKPQGIFVGLHHPKGSVQRYSVSTKPITIQSFSAGPARWENSHWMIELWDVGTTAGGSSGSPLFDGQGYIIGALSGGNSYCDSPFRDFYYALKSCWRDASKSQEEQLAPFLDPIGSGSLLCSGWEPFGHRQPLRLSHILYNPALRDNLQDPATPSATPIRGAGSSFPIKEASQLFGAVAVVGAVEQWSPSLWLVGLRSNKNETYREIFRKKVEHPRYSYTFNSTTSGAERSLGHGMQFYIDLQNEGQLLSAGDTLHLALFDAENTLPLMRTARNSEALQPALHWDEQSNRWIAAALDPHPARSYGGAYWIDAIIAPTGESRPDIRQNPMPRFLFDGYNVLILFPEEVNLSSKKITAVLSDALGRIWETKAVTHPVTSFPIVTQELPSGVYLVSLYGYGKPITYKLFLPLSH